MMMEGMDLIPLESDLHKYDLVIISQIINMIETDSFWHHKTFESVLSDLQNMWTKGIHELENASCTVKIIPKTMLNGWGRGYRPV